MVKLNHDIDVIDFSKVKKKKLTHQEHRLGIYIRVSTKSQLEDLEQQKVIGKRVAKKLNYKENEIIWYDEGAKSSTSGVKRFQLIQLQDDIENGSLDTIWTLDRSRMFRKMSQSIRFWEEYLAKYQITLYEGEHLQKWSSLSRQEKMMYSFYTSLSPE